MGEAKGAWSYPQALATEGLATVGPVALSEATGAVSLNQATPFPGRALSAQRGPGGPKEPGQGPQERRARSWGQSFTE